MGKLIELLLLALIAGVCGFLASQLMGARRMHPLMMVILGFVGAWLGRFIAGWLHLPLGLSISLGAGPSFPILWAIIGSVVVVGIASLISQH